MFEVGHSLLRDYTRPYRPSTVSLRVVKPSTGGENIAFLGSSEAADCSSLNGGISVVHHFFRNALSGAAILANLGTKRR